MKITLVSDRHLASINTRLGEIEMKLSEAVTVMNEIKANLAEASAEIGSKIDSLENLVKGYAEAIDADPAEAMAMLESIRTAAQGLADIVPDAPTE
jgi:hypothetical protein